jgi:hypothetical protein
MFVARNKRVLWIPKEPGSQVMQRIDLGDMYLSDFIQPEMYAVDELLSMGLNKAMSLLQKPEMIKLMNRIGFFNMVVKEVWNVANVTIKYRRDTYTMKRADFWLLPNETWEMGVGDCEDTTFLVASAIDRLSSGWSRVDETAKESKYYAMLGYYLEGGNYYGHAWVVYHSTKIWKDWLWIETTLESEVSQSIWYPVSWNVLVPVYWFNKKEAYRIDKDYDMLGLKQEFVERHWRYIEAMISYVEEGVIEAMAKTSWRHKQKRPARPAREIVLG